MYDGTQRWSDLPPARKRLVYLLIGLGLAIGVGSIAAGDRVMAISMHFLATIGYGLATVMCVIRLFLMWMERGQRPVSRFVAVCIFLLMLIFAALTYDEIVSY